MGCFPKSGAGPELSQGLCDYIVYIGNGWVQNPLERTESKLFLVGGGLEEGLQEEGLGVRARIPLE